MPESKGDEIIVLIVDDEDPPVRELTAVFGEERNNSELPFLVSSVKSVEEFQAFVKNQVVPDVLIADLKLTEEEGVDCGVDKVISWQMILNPESIVIVHSAFPSRQDSIDPIAEAVEICVKAMRAGACACYKKSVDSAEYAVKEVIREIKRRRTHEVDFDVAWWNSNLAQLQKEYGGRAVAVRGQHVLESSETVAQLRDKLRQVVLGGALPTILFVPSGDD